MTLVPVLPYFGDEFGKIDENIPFIRFIENISNPNSDTAPWLEVSGSQLDFFA